MPDKKLLITRPDYDDTTSYLYKWGEQIIESAKSKNIIVLDLNKERSNKNNFKSFIEAHQPRLVVLNGHGNESEILGNDKKPLVKAGENHHLLKSKVVYAISCGSAKDLGRKSVDDGTDVFIGYVEDFIFAVNTSKTTVPLEDDFAKPFMEASNTVPLSFIKGNNANDAFQKSQKTFQKFIDYYKANYTPESSHIMFFLRWDMMVQQLLGNVNSNF